MGDSWSCLSCIGAEEPPVRRLSDDMTICMFSSVGRVDGLDAVKWPVGISVIYCLSNRSTVALCP